MTRDKCNTLQLLSNCTHYQNTTTKILYNIASRYVRNEDVLCIKFKILAYNCIKTRIYGCNENNCSLPLFQICVSKKSIRKPLISIREQGCIPGGLGGVALLLNSGLSPLVKHLALQMT